MNHKIYGAILFSAVLGMPAHAESGADLLFQSQKSMPLQNEVSSQPSEIHAAFQLDDPFSSHLFSTWKTQSGFSYEVNAWVQFILQKKYAEAAHLWTLIEPKLPEIFQNPGKAAWLYTLWKMDLPQTFVDQWLKAQAQTIFVKSKDNAVLDLIFAQDFDRYLTQNEISLTQTQIENIQKLDSARGSHILSLLAYSALRSGDRAVAIVPMLPATHSMKIALAQTAALSLAQKQDLGAAGKMMKTQLEPAIDAGKDPLALSSYYLQLARLLYQAGMLDASESYYSKIPKGTAEYLKAREEITWIYLRKGDVQKLRGELVALSMPVFKEKFAPEVPLVRAISNLKLCYYDAVSKDFQDFLAVNQKWAMKIDQALKAGEISTSDTPDTEDAFTQTASRAVARREGELSRIAQYSEDSIRVALPAVGPQSHWLKLKEEMMMDVAWAKKTLSAEYRRQWKNQRFLLTEAIRKMRFVKVEFMSQVADLKQSRENQMAQGSNDTLRTSSASAISAPTQNSVQVKTDEIAFRFDGLYWPDELFKLRSDAREQCMRIRGIQ